ncbi:hypothetical protein GGF31_006086 [Allomyces arbusculus]|nr:hypothetical protein GGF31_006086 [Allomyces arbusculus]
MATQIVTLLDNVLVTPVAAFIQRTSPLVHAGHVEESDYWGYWFLSPRQHVLEFVGLNAIFLSSLPFLLNSDRGRKVQAQLMKTASRQMHLVQSRIDEASLAVQSKLDEASLAVQSKLDEASLAVQTRIDEASQAVQSTLDDMHTTAHQAVHDVSQRVTESVHEASLRVSETANDLVNEPVCPTPRLSWPWRVGVPQAMLITSWLITFHQKYHEGTLFFMLQPCHMSAGLLAALLATPRSWQPRHLLFNLFTCAQWGAVLALAQPDLRTHKTPLHISNFIAEHVLILAVPIWLARTGEYSVVTSRRLMVALLAFVAVALYHSAGLAVLGVFSGVNLNYVLSPPPGPLAMFGKWYRLAMFFGAMVLTIGMRFIYMDGMLAAATWAERAVKWVARTVRGERSADKVKGE